MIRFGYPLDCRHKLCILSLVGREQTAGLVAALGINTELWYPPTQQ